MIISEELTLREKQVYHYSRQTGATTAVVSSLYQGNTFEKYSSLMSEVVSSHDSFALQNKFDYLLYDDTINKENNLYREDINLADVCLGMNKWLVIDHALKTYEKVLFVDYDSVFISDNIIKLNHDTILSPIPGSSYHDSVFLLLYLMYKNISFENLVEYTHKEKYNSGFMLISRGFFKIDDVHEFIEFAYKIYKGGYTDSWIGIHDFDYSNISSMSKTTLTPFDEVFLMYLIIKNRTIPEYFDTKLYNVYDKNIVNNETVHVHFCVDKPQFFEFFQTGVEGWKEKK